MKRNDKNILMVICVLVLVALFPCVAISADSVTIVGTVNADYQIVTDDNQVYEVDATPKGDEVVLLINKKVKVTGMVEESTGVKMIAVTSYEVIEKQSK